MKEEKTMEEDEQFCQPYRSIAGLPYVSALHEAETRRRSRCNLDGVTEAEEDERPTPRGAKHIWHRG